MSEQKRVAFMSLGCAKNLVDSEKMLGQLALAGCEITTDPDNADTIVVNTCGFLDAARVEAHDAIHEAITHKSTGRCQRVVVTGCLVQRDQTRLLDDVPGIDALVGVNNRDDVVSAVLGQSNKTTQNLYLGDYYWRQDDDRDRLRLTPQHYAYLRISEGCDQKCTFCTIPSIRGPMHCKSVDQILVEARQLVADGAVELNLIGQDTTSYGQDLNYEPGLGGLLRALNELDSVEWIRLLYAYPTAFDVTIMEAIADCDRVVNYVDMPLQHINDRVLKSMHRRVTRQQTIDLLGDLRERIPDVAIRTTMIVGFPGETDAEFEELMDFVESSEFEALGVFPYSLEPDTPAGRMQGQVPEEVKQQRVDELMAVQQEVAFSKASRWIGREFPVLIEGHAVNGAHPARHAGQAPEVDSLTYVSGQRYDPGTMVTVKCIGTNDYDLVAQPIDVRLPIIG